MNSICLKFLALFTFAIHVLLGPEAQAADDCGFLYDRFELTLDEGFRSEAFGPFFYRETTDSENTFALPPLFSRVDAPDVERLEYDFLYPLLTMDRYGTEYRWQLFQLLSFAGGDDQEGKSDRRFTLFPFYFQQRSEEAGRDYHALFPIYGHLERRLFRSEIDFVLWPLYVKTIRRPSASPVESDPFQSPLNRFFSARRGEVTTINYLYPIFHRRYGDGLTGWQVWPLGGHEVKELTSRTNAWGDLESLPGHEKRFVLWPFYADERRNLGTDNPEHHQLLLPFYSFLRSPQRDSTSYLWPLGVTITEDRARKYREVAAPWPIIGFARGEGKTANRFWPVYGSASNEALESRFFLWPLYKYNRVKSGALDRERHRVLFFVGGAVSEKNLETGAAKKWSAIWPLYTHRRDFDGSTRMQVLALLEPVLPASKSIARNYSPVWSLWRAENNVRAGKTSRSLLWNLYRSERTPESKKCSLLLGLFQYQSDAEGRRVRLFYVPISRSGERPKAVE